MIPTARPRRSRSGCPSNRFAVPHTPLRRSRSYSPGAGSKRACPRAPTPPSRSHARRRCTARNRVAAHRRRCRPIPGAQNVYEAESPCRRKLLGTQFGADDRVGIHDRCAQRLGVRSPRADDRALDAASRNGSPSPAPSTSTTESHSCGHASWTGRPVSAGFVGCEGKIEDTPGIGICGDWRTSVASPGNEGVGHAIERHAEHRRRGDAVAEILPSPRLGYRGRR